MERGRPDAWTIEEMGARFQSLSSGVVGFHADVRDVECRFKLGAGRARGSLCGDSRGPRECTTEAILDAAAHILGERGWAGITTNAVAETAGVSIGSLYQYFPNKLALIEAVRRLHFDELLSVLRVATDNNIPRARSIAA